MGDYDDIKEEKSYKQTRREIRIGFVVFLVLCCIGLLVATWAFSWFVYIIDVLTY